MFNNFVQILDLITTLIVLDMLKTMLLGEIISYYIKEMYIVIQDEFANNSSRMITFT